MRRLIIGVGLSALLAPAAAFAHHSFAMFDGTKSLTLKGAVKEVQWTNPHVWIQVLVPAAGGAPEEWSLESGAIAGLKRVGWTRETLKPGDVVTIVTHPAKAAGARRASVVSVTLADGRTLTSPGFNVTATTHSIEGQP